MLFDFSAYQPDEVHQANMDFSAYFQKEIATIGESKLPASAVRVQQVEELTEAFYSHFGEHMNTVCLYYLSNYILQDFIKNKLYNKTTTQENGFLSPRQLYTRNKTELAYPVEILDVCRVNSLFNITRPKRTVNMYDV